MYAIVWSYIRSIHILRGRNLGRGSVQYMYIQYVLLISVQANLGCCIVDCCGGAILTTYHDPGYLFTLLQHDELRSSPIQNPLRGRGKLCLTWECIDTYIHWTLSSGLYILYIPIPCTCRYSVKTTRRLDQACMDKEQQYIYMRKCVYVCMYVCMYAPGVCVVYAGVFLYWGIK